MLIASVSFCQASPLGVLTFYLSSGSVFIRQYRVLYGSLFAALGVQVSVTTGPLLHFQHSPVWKCRSQHCPLAVLWPFPGNTSLLGSPPVFLIWFASVLVICMLKYAETFWSPIFLTECRNIAQFSMESSDFIYKAHLGVKSSIWHSRDLIKSVSMGWLACSGNWHNAITFSPAPGRISTASPYHFLCHRHCLLLP